MDKITKRLWHLIVIVIATIIIEMTFSFGFIELVSGKYNYIETIFVVSVILIAIVIVLYFLFAIVLETGDLLLLKRQKLAVDEGKIADSENLTSKQKRFMKMSDEPDGYHQWRQSEREYYKKEENSEKLICKYHYLNMLCEKIEDSSNVFKFYVALVPVFIAMITMTGLYTGKVQDAIAEMCQNVISTTSQSNLSMEQYRSFASQAMQIKEELNDKMFRLTMIGICAFIVIGLIAWIIQSLMDKRKKYQKVFYLEEMYILKEVMDDEHVAY